MGACSNESSSFRYEDLIPCYTRNANKGPGVQSSAHACCTAAILIGQRACIYSDVSPGKVPSSWLNAQYPADRCLTLSPNVGPGGRVCNKPSGPNSHFHLEPGEGNRTRFGSGVSEDKILQTSSTSPPFTLDNVHLEVTLLSWKKNLLGIHRFHFTEILAYESFFLRMASNTINGSLIFYLESRVNYRVVECPSRFMVYAIDVRSLRGRYLYVFHHAQWSTDTLQRKDGIPNPCPHHAVSFRKEPQRFPLSKTRLTACTGKI